MLELKIDFSKVEIGYILINLTGELTSATTFYIEALKNPDENFIDLLTLNNQQINLSTELIEVKAGSFDLTYRISSPFKKFMGSHLDYDINYPFFNKDEAFVGSGIFPMFNIASNSAATINFYDLEFLNLPRHWSVISNLMVDGQVKSPITPEQASQFFLYLSKNAKTYSDSNFKCTIAADVILPLEPKELFLFCKKSLKTHEEVFGEIPKIKDLIILILQSPNDFDIIANHKTFSTAENYIGGIVFYGPNREDVYKKLGHSDYRDFILGGLHHEIGHAYTSAGPAKLKSILFASNKCSRDDRFLIGEALNAYFNDTTRLIFDENHNFSLQTFINDIKPKITKGNRVYTLDLFLFECALRSELGISLYRVFNDLLEKNRRCDIAYDSANILIEASENLSNKLLSLRSKNLILNPENQYYLTNLELALSSQGFNQENLPNDTIATIDFFLRK